MDEVMDDTKAGEQVVATLWQLIWNDNALVCRVSRIAHGFRLSVESPSAVIVEERFDLEPRAVMRAHALGEALRRRGWSDVKGPGS
jgi:hypothetical protein